jgi:S-adenosylmethionine synthetase
MLAERDYAVFSVSRDANQLEVQLAHAIGVAEPVWLMITTFGTGTDPEVKLPELVRKPCPVRPADTIDPLELVRQVFRATAVDNQY